MRIIITGGTGLIGRALSKELLSDNHEVIALSRRPAHASGMPAGIRMRRWDAATATDWGELADGAEAIINLAGESIGGEHFFPDRWTPEKKERILRSRLNAGQAVAEAVMAAERKPRVVIQASAVGYYGTSEEATFVEDDPPGDDFVAGVVPQWEQSTEIVTEHGVRHVVCRTGVVLSAEGGALPRLLLPFKLFVGGPMGSGRQWLSWIHLEDVVRAILFLLHRESAGGPYNLTAPEPVRNQEMAKRLGKIMGRPAFIPLPGFVLKTMFGEVATVVMEGQKVLPQRLQEAGFTFKYPQLEGALRDLVR